jgi:cytochrome b subunit of formate dehydrogenase
MNTTHDSAIRFTTQQRLQHVSVMVLFILLALTGFPQKWPELGVSRALVDAMGGPASARFVHRVAGVLFTVLTAVHLGSLVLLLAMRRMKATLIPTKKDFRDAVTQIRYDLGLTEERPKFDRFDYRQKFEYWGLLMGGAIMISTGIVLLAPILLTRWLPGDVVPIAKVAHSNEAMLAFLVILTWHLFNAHLAPGIFPFDTTIFTGRISLERMRHEHPLEYERVTAKAPEAREGETVAQSAAALPVSG